MDKLFVLAILLSLNASVFSVFLAPGILDQKTSKIFDFLENSEV